MKIKRCHLCNFLKNKNRCYFLTAKDRAKGFKYHIITSKMFCEMRGEKCEELEEPEVKEPEAEPEINEVEQRKSNLNEFKKELLKRALK